MSFSAGKNLQTNINTSEAQTLSNKTLDNTNAINGAPVQDSELSNVSITSPEKLQMKQYADLATAQADLANRSGGELVYVADIKKTYQVNDDGLGTKTLAEISGGQGGVNYIENSDFEQGVDGYTDDVNFTIAQTKVAGEILRGEASAKLSKAAVDASNEEISVPFTVSRADLAKKLTVSFEYDASDVNYADDDIQVYVKQDPNGTPSVIRINGEDLKGGKGTHYAQFQTDASQTEYELVFKVNSTNASAYSVIIDDVKVGPTNLAKGTIVTDWKEFTPTGSLSTNVEYSGLYKREGDCLKVKARIDFTGPNTDGAVEIDIPFGLSIDYNKALGTSFSEIVGSGSFSGNFSNYLSAIIRNNNVIRATLHRSRDTLSASLSGVNGSVFVQRGGHKGNFIQSSVKSSTGTYTITFTPGYFTSDPHIVATALADTNNYISVESVNKDGAVIISRQSSNDTLEDSNFFILLNHPHHTDSVVRSSIDTGLNLPYKVESGNFITLDFSVPIQGWSSNAVMSEDLGGRDVEYKAQTVDKYPTSLSAGFNKLDIASVYDTIAMHDSVNNRAIIKESGYYTINAKVEIAGGSIPTDECYVTIYKNGTEINDARGNRIGTTFSGSETRMSQIVIENYFNKQDYIEIYIHVPNAVSLNLYSRGFLSIRKMPSPQTILESETVAARYTSSNAQGFDHSAHTPIIFENLEYDTHNAYDTETGVYTAAVSGIYSIKSNVTFPGGELVDDSGRIQLNIRIDDPSVAFREYTINNIGTRQSFDISSDIQLNKGDSMTITLFHDNGADTNEINLNPTDYMNYLTIHRIK